LCCSSEEAPDRRTRCGVCERSRHPGGEESQKVEGSLVSSDPSSVAEHHATRWHRASKVQEEFRRVNARVRATWFANRSVSCWSLRRTSPGVDGDAQLVEIWQPDAELPLIGRDRLTSFVSPPRRAVRWSSPLRPSGSPLGTPSPQCGEGDLRGIENLSCRSPSPEGRGGQGVRTNETGRAAPWGED
jgi:hypothetical protein